MKKLLIFDLGEVMVRFSPIDMCRKFIKDESEARLVCDTLFDRLYWDRLDAGTIDDDELLSAVKERLPEELFPVAELIYSSWFYSLPEIPGMRELALEFKEKYSLSLVLLSNTARALYEKENEIPILKIFDKRFYSAVVGYVKPSREIFDYLCDTCEVLPSEAIFVDDNEKNVLAAQKCGIKSVRFTGNVEKLRQELVEIFEN